MPEIHPRFSPSAANRRIHCPPSLLLEEQFEEGESVYAAEGTAGHAIRMISALRSLSIMADHLPSLALGG